MKVRESGMPEEDRWRQFFDADRILTLLGLTPVVSDAADFGCGYGTFTIPAARRIRGLVHGFDIEQGMIEETRKKADSLGLTNVLLYRKDFVSEGTGLADSSVNYVMLFNILHAEDPGCLLREAHRILTAGGIVGVMHWNPDPKTPRGPSMEIRPTPEQCRMWMTDETFEILDARVDLPPYHYGIIGRKG